MYEVSTASMNTLTGTVVWILTVVVFNNMNYCDIHTVIIIHTVHTVIQYCTCITDKLWIGITGTVQILSMYCCIEYLLYE